MSEIYYALPWAYGEFLHFTHRSTAHFRILHSAIYLMHSTLPHFTNSLHKHIYRVPEEVRVREKITQTYEQQYCPFLLVTVLVTSNYLLHQKTHLDHYQTTTFPICQQAQKN